MMAARAILRRRRILSDYLHISGRSIRGLRHGIGATCSESGDSSLTQDNTFSDFSSRKYDDDAYFIRHEGFKNLSALGLFRDQKFHTITGHGALGNMLHTRVNLVLQSSSYASVAAAPKPNLGGEEEDKEQVANKRKEASPEECDQAVEGLTSAKAKVKAKQVTESQKLVNSILKRTWAMLLGIGPALRAVASMSREDWAKKLVHWKNEFVDTLKHYWLGIKLLGVDVKISSRLLLKLAGGKSLSRRERQQLTRTTADIFRLVPVAVFIIVPFMEFLLPVFLKLFPNMLPSTFQDKMKEQEALKRKLNARIEYAKFLQDTVKEMAKEVQNTRSGEVKKTAEDLDDFLSKVRTGGSVSNEEILGFAKLFNDELTLDNISRPRLVNMCKYMGIQPFGTDAYLRYMLRKRLQWIKNDDKMIQAEGGVDALSEDELREDCRERGMLGLRSVEEMRQQLRDWLDLSLNHSVPSSLLILSRAFTVSGKLRPEEVVRATLSSLPDEVVDTVGVTALPSEDSVSERRRKLEFLEMQEELIKEEEEKEEEEQAKMKQSISSNKDVALEEMVSATASDMQEQARARVLDKQEQLCKVSEALAVLASASSVSREREEFLRLVNKEINLYHSMMDKEGTDTVKAYKAAHEESDNSSDEHVADKVSSALINRVDAMLQKLEKEIDDVDAKIGDRWRVLDRDYDGKVTPEEVASAAIYLKDTLGKEGVLELISNLSKDKDMKNLRLLYSSIMMQGLGFAVISRHYRSNPKVDLKKLRPMILKRIENRAKDYPVKAMIPVAYDVVRSRALLIQGVSTLLQVIPIWSCKFCPEVYIGEQGHAIKTCRGYKRHAKNKLHEWIKGGINDIIIPVDTFHLKKMFQDVIKHDERFDYNRIPAVVELSLQAGADLNAEELSPNKLECLGAEYLSNDDMRLVAEGTLRAWEAVRSGVQKLLMVYSAKVCKHCSEVHVGPSGHKARMCGVFKYEGWRGTHLWTKAQVDDLVPPKIVWFRRPQDPAVLDDKWRSFYGHAPAVVDLCTKAGAIAPPKYYCMMKVQGLPADVPFKTRGLPTDVPFRTRG